MKYIKNLSFLLITVLFVSCGAMGGGTGVTKTSDQVFEPTDPNSVEIFITQKPSKQYTEIGTISVLRVKSPVFPRPRPAEKIKEEMKQKAAAIGGNAIIDYRESGEANMVGTIIRFK